MDSYYVGFGEDASVLWNKTATKKENHIYVFIISFHWVAKYCCKHKLLSINFSKYCCTYNLMLFLSDFFFF